MTYARAFELSNPAYFQLSIDEGWNDEWERAAEHVRIADYDYSAGIIDSVTAYDD